MQRPLVLDGRNLLNSDDMLALGFEYVGVGKPIAEAWESKSSARQLT
jgi:hypothetical protein